LQLIESGPLITNLSIDDAPNRDSSQLDLGSRRRYSISRPGVRPSKCPYYGDQITFGDHHVYGHVEIRECPLLIMHGGLIFLEISRPVEPMILEISGIDLVRDLKLPLIEDLLEHSFSYGLVSGFPGRRIRNVIGSRDRSGQH
jgi:hypothetical protein